MKKIIGGSLLLLLLAGSLVYKYSLPDASPHVVETPQVNEQETAQPSKEAAKPTAAPNVPEKVIPKPTQKQAASPDMAPITMEKGKTGAHEDKNSYEEYDYSLKKTENPGFKLAPGVTVKSGAIHIKQDAESTQSVTIERKPQNSNNDYQVTWQNKF